MVNSRKATTKPSEKKFPRSELQVFVDPDDDKEQVARKISASITSTEMAALRVIRGAERTSGYLDKIDFPALAEQLRGQAAAVNRGDLSQAEAMLMNQATALQSLFARLAERGMAHDSIPGFDANMRMALRAQSQCRATLETLAAIKNPPIVYARQANITSGPQQVNNGVTTQARENQIEQSKLSEVSNELLPDTRASQEASRLNPAVEAVGTIDGAEVARG